MQFIIRILACTALGCSALLSQFGNATISGIITDPSGAAIPGVSVSAANNRTGVSIETKSNPSGAYLFPALQPGSYDVTAKHEGFRQFVARSVVLEVGAQATSNIELEVGSLAEAIEVFANAESPIHTASVSVGNVVSSRRMLDLPLVGRDPGALIALQAGVVGDNFHGLRAISQNVTFDGINIQEPRFVGGATSTNIAITNSIDRVAEFRVVTAPADAEFGRGSGQVIMISRSGTNEFHGSVFAQNRVTALSANKWFNNQLGRRADGTLVTPRDFLIRNQYGVRTGGPIVKNRTFWHFLYEGDRSTTKGAFNTTVLTDTARQGIFRFYPGVRNGIATASTPTVDFNGNPVRPAGATGDLQSVSIFGRDPNRPAPDPTGSVAKMLALYPKPNHFLRGDGLNTAGFLWQRRATSVNDFYNAKVDHVITDAHRLAVNWHWEYGEDFNGFRNQTFPASQPDYAKNWTHFAVGSLTSAFRPDLINEFRIGMNRYRSDLQSPWVVGGTDILPMKGNQPFFLDMLSVTDVYDLVMAPQGRTSPVYQVSNNTTWLRGKHALKGGVELRFVSSNGFNSFYAVPSAIIGAGAPAAAVQNIGTIAGIGQNQAVAQDLLLDLSGSLGQWAQQFNSPGGKDPQFIAGENNQRTWRQREYSFFLKDDWKVSRRLTLNLGLRYEYYGVPFEANGKAAIPVNGSAGIFGISGTDFGALFHPNATGGQLTQLHLIGPGTNNPDTELFKADLNNFGPNVGFSWLLPGEKTVFRVGYGLNYDRTQLRNVDVVAGDVSGFNQLRRYTSAEALSLANVPVPIQPVGRPLSVVPFSDRLQGLRVFDTGLVTPYSESWNVSLQREIGKSSAVTVRYVGTKGAKLLRGTNVNEINVLENGILEAFNTTRQGGNAPLFDRLFNGLAVPGQGNVNGTTIRGSDYARSNSTIQGHLANGNVGAFGSFLNSANVFGRNGGLLQNAGLPENFIVVNPQYAAGSLVSNYGSSSYHALQVEYEKRFSTGWTYQGNYTFSKALGEFEGADQTYEDPYRTLRDRSADKRLLAYHRSHSLKSNGTWELPFGRNKRFGRGMSRFVDAIAGGWQVAGIFFLYSGRPFDVNAEVSTFNGVAADNTPDVTGDFPKSTGTLTFDGNGPHYFPGFTSEDDPRRNSLPASFRNLNTLRVIKDAQGGIVLQSPNPGALGNLGSRYLSGPSEFNIDMALSKTFTITERVAFELRTDWTNVTNTPSFANVTDNMTRNINSPNFGRITNTSNNPRVVVLGGRINF